MANPKGTAKNLRPPKKGEIRNPKGAPKKIVSVLNAELLAEGYTPVTDSQVIDCLRTLINLPLSRLKDIASHSNDDYPMLYKKMALALTNPKDMQTLEKILDRAYGRAKQALDVTTNGKEINRLTPLSELTEAQALELLSKRNNV